MKVSLVTNEKLEKIVLLAKINITLFTKNKYIDTHTQQCFTNFMSIYSNRDLIFTY